MPAAQREQRCLEHGAQADRDGEAQHGLEHLRPPDGAHVKVHIPPVEPVGKCHAQHRTEQRVGVLAAGGEVGGVHVRGKRPELGKEQIRKAQHGHGAEEPVEPVRVAVNVAKERVERKHQHEPDAERHADIQRCVHAEVHARKRREHDHDGADHAQPRPPRPAAEAAEGGEDILRVSARERVAGGLGPGALDDAEIRVLHPWARDTEHQLEKLVDDRADEADREHIVPAGLAHAPEHDDGDGHEHDLAAAIGDCAEHRVKPRRAQLCQRIKQLHV